MIVTGKGGTGKTTVAAALAHGAAARGRRVLLAAVDPDARLGGLLGAPRAKLTYTPVQAGGVAFCHIEPFEALSEYLGLQLGTRRLVDPVIRQKAFQQFLMAAPGWRDLITLGKVWHLEQMEEGRRPRYDLIVVDAPATGHGLTFLDVPRVVVSAVRAGPLRQHTEAVETLIGDRTRSVLLPVAIGEELPARETIELVQRVHGELDIGLERVVVNAVHAPPYPPAFEGLETTLAALPGDRDFGNLPSPGWLAECGALLRDRASLNARYVAEIADETELPITELPYLPNGLRGPADLDTLSEALLGAPS